MLRGSEQNLSEQTVQFPGDGITLSAHLVLPSSREPRPAIVVVQEWWGLNDHIKDVARRYAAQGFVAVAPDLYSRLGHPVVPNSQSTEAGRLMNALKQEDGLKDLNATVAYLQGLAEVDANRIAVTGFCMGGSYALLLACFNPMIKAAVSFYGQIPNPDDPLEQLRCPILYLYGEDDGWITRGDVQRLASALKKYRKAGDIKTYPGVAHAFFNDTRPEVYKPAEAKDAWEQALRFLRQQLRM